MNHSNHSTTLIDNTIARGRELFGLPFVRQGDLAVVTLPNLAARIVAIDLGGLDQVEPSKPTKPTTRATPPKKAKPDPKPSDPLSHEEKCKAVLALAVESPKLTGATIAHLWEPEGFTKKTRGNKARELLWQLALERRLEKHGEGPGSFYTLKGKGPKKPKPKPKDHQGGDE